MMTMITRLLAGVLCLTHAVCFAAAQPAPVLELGYEQSEPPILDRAEPSSTGEFGPDTHAPSFSDDVADDAPGETSLAFDAFGVSFVDFGKGADDELVLGTSGDQQPDELTLRTRFKLNSVTNNGMQTFVAFDGNDASHSALDSGWLLGTRRGKKLGFIMKFDGGAGPRYVEGETELEAGRWYDVVAQVRGSGEGEPGFVRIYLDGELDGETAIPANNGALRNFNQPKNARLVLGAKLPVNDDGELDPLNASRPLDGLLDETVLYEAITERP